MKCSMCYMYVEHALLQVSNKGFVLQDNYSSLRMLVLLEVVLCI